LDGILGRSRTSACAEAARIQAALDQQIAERLDAAAAASKAEEQATALRE
jgi:hypothetical protein